MLRGTSFLGWNSWKRRKEFMGALSDPDLMKPPTQVWLYLGGRLGIAGQWLLICIGLLLLLIPVILLFIGTSVPLYLSAALLLSDLILLVLWLRHLYLNTLLMFVGCLLVAATAVALSQLFAATP